MQRHGKVTGMKSDDFIAKGDCGRLRSGAKRSKCPWGTRISCQCSANQDGCCGGIAAGIGTENMPPAYFLNALMPEK